MYNCNTSVNVDPNVSVYFLGEYQLTVQVIVTPSDQ